MKIFWLVFLSVIILATKISAQQLNFQLTQKEWLEDVTYLKKQVEKTVPIYQMAERKRAFDSIYDIIMDNVESAPADHLVFEEADGESVFVISGTLENPRQIGFLSAESLLQYDIGKYLVSGPTANQEVGLILGTSRHPN